MIVIQKGFLALDNPYIISIWEEDTRKKKGQEIRSKCAL